MPLHSPSVRRDEGFPVAEGAIGELFWNVAEAVLVCRPGRVLAWNPGAEAIFDMTAAEATAPDADLKRAFGNATDQLWELVEVGAGKARLECTGGSERVLDATAWRLGGNGSSPTVVVLHDVTDEQRHLAGRQHLEAFAGELLTESSLDVLLVRIVDAAKELARADFSALLLLREQSEEEVEHFVYNAPRELFPERLPRAVGLLAVPIQTRSVTRLDDIRGHPAGVGIPVEHPPIGALLAAPIVMGERVAGELAVANTPDRITFDDVDEALIRELSSLTAITVSLVTARVAQEKVQETRRALVDLVLGNIQTPLTVAQESLAVLRSRWGELSEEERDGSFEAIERAHEQMQALTDGSLLEEPTPPGGTSLQEIVDIDVPELVEELASDLAQLRPEVALEASVETGWSPAFASDRRLVRELLESLVTNAVNHSPPGETVSITARSEGSSVRFDVTDRGPGIPPDDQARIFDQFYRTGQSVADDVPGTGLGLWIARRLASLLGGTIGISSRSGQGSTFWATLPLQPPLRRSAPPS